MSPAEGQSGSGVCRRSAVPPCEPPTERRGGEERGGGRRTRGGRANSRDVFDLQFSGPSQTFSLDSKSLRTSIPACKASLQPNPIDPLPNLPKQLSQPIPRRIHSGLQRAPGPSSNVQRHRSDIQVDPLTRLRPRRRMRDLRLERRCRECKGGVSGHLEEAVRGSARATGAREWTDVLELCTQVPPRRRRVPAPIGPEGPTEPPSPCPEANWALSAATVLASS